MSNKLARNYNFFSLLKFSLPTIAMMVFMSLYTMVDGVFVSRLVGTNALAAVNVVFPLLNVVMAVGIMLATGGSAVVAKKMGEGKLEEARQDFTFIAAVGVGLGLVMALLAWVFRAPLLGMLGANDAIYQLCYEYMVALIPFVVPAMLQVLFQTFFVTAGRPGVGLVVTALGGVANILLDYVFIALFGWGIAGAALATGIGMCIPALFGLVWFGFNKYGSLYFVRPVARGAVLLNTLANGSSEMVTNLSSAIITYLFNLNMLRMLGEDGVAAMTIVLYAEYLLVAVYLGFSSGIAPILSYNHGEGNLPQLKRLFKISMWFLAACSLLTFVGAMFAAGPVVTIFARQGTNVYQLAVHGFGLYSLCYLFKGVNIYASSMFTALSDGKTSAALSFMRSLVFIAAGIWLLPLVWGVNGLWLAVPVAEALSLLLSLYSFYRLFNGAWKHKGKKKARVG